MARMCIECVHSAHHQTGELRSQVPAEWVRTSVGAQPHIVVVVDETTAVAADDVDGAGSVDRGRVPISRSPRRLCDH